MNFFDFETIPFVTTVANGTRITMVTRRFDDGAEIPLVQYFPLVNSRDVEITFWETDALIANNVNPLSSHSRILGSEYTPSDNDDDSTPVFVGDSGPIDIYLNAKISKNKRFAVSFNNTNTTHNRPMNLLAHRRLK